MLKWTPSISKFEIFFNSLLTLLFVTVHMKGKMISAYLKDLSKVQKNGVFLLEIYSFVSEILTFFYYAN